MQNAKCKNLKANSKMEGKEEELRYKFKYLKEILSQMEGLLIAYSGGVDSTFLLKVALDVLGKNKVLAVTANSKTYPPEELELAKERAKTLGAKHLVIETQELNNPKFTSNPLNRCYYCKEELFSTLRALARGEDLIFIADGSNFDDQKDFRPGREAALKFGIRSPLKEASLTKKDIRRISRSLNLPTWNKPSQACLSSRFPYKVKITEENLIKVYEAEKYLHSLGIRQLRVRHHSEIARIEVEKEELPKFFRNGLEEKVARKFKDLGYTYITLDLEGYRSGSLNSLVIKR